MEKTWGTVATIIIVVLVILVSIAVVSKIRTGQEGISEPLDDFECTLRQAACVLPAECLSDSVLEEISCGEGYVCCLEKAS